MLPKDSVLKASNYTSLSEQSLGPKKIVEAMLSLMIPRGVMGQVRPAPTQLWKHRTVSDPRLT